MRAIEEKLKKHPKSFFIPKLMSELKRTCPPDAGWCNHTVDFGEELSEQTLQELLLHARSRDAISAERNHDDLPPNVLH
jgi:hypothetical protein